MTILIGSNFEGIFQLTVTFVIFVFVLALTFFTTRWIAKYQKNQSANKNIHIIESVSVGTNKVIAVVEVGGEYFVVGIGKEEIHFLSKVDGDKITINENEAGSSNSSRNFSEILSEFKSRIGK
ncbi:MAG: flagellar biosynthetic protein FliO [Lachnospiraceae bacterium]|nr:flagellar biosynthetic protein FliO [Lachnospiraceae bacterium]